MVAHRLGRPRGAKSTNTRERIVLVARGVFSEFGYDAATFQAIAVRADLTRPAINHYFASKMLLYREVLDRTSRLAIAPAIERARHETTLLTRLSSYLTPLVEENIADRTFGGFVVAAFLEAQRHPELRGATDDMQSETREFLTWVVTEAVERGEVVTDRDVASLVEMLIAIMWGIAFYSGFIGTSQQLEAASENIQLLLAQQLWQLNV